MRTEGSEMYLPRFTFWIRRNTPDLVIYSALDHLRFVLLYL